ncbi:hypothetical protein [Candidatus Symbiothrix dinenymphae]|uniref:hypothetical protein n=1 Tax=Candidatus Symbiothrix dinenymphae TaxID=467085 RepID=UPI0006E3FE6C|nr:hypothetical protein [Candidatus Symbiothrix dinenymphae]
MKNLRNVFFVAATAACASVFVGCDSDDPLNVNQRDRFSIYVADNNGPLAGATVKSLSDGTEATTDEGGIAALEVPAGNTLVSVGKEGYATALASLPSSSNVTLTKSGAKVSGYVTLSDTIGTGSISRENVSPAASVSFEITLQGSYLTRKFSATTDVNGKYEITGLPENASFTFASEITVNGKKYSTGGYTHPTGTVNAPSPVSVQYNQVIPAVEPFEIISYLATVGLNASIVIKFNQAVASESLYTSPSGGTVTYTGNTVTIAPPVGGWIGSLEYVDGFVVSANGQYSYPRKQILIK